MSRNRLLIIIIFPGNFMVLGLTFKFNPLWVDFCVWCENVVWFDSLACNWPILPTSFIKGTSFPHHCIVCLLCCRLNNQISLGSFLGFLFCLTGFICLFVLVPVMYYSDYTSSVITYLIVQVWNHGVRYFQLRSFSELFWIFGFFCVSIHILESFGPVYKVSLVFCRKCTEPLNSLV